MSYDFIDQHKTEWPVSRMCDALDVSKAGYYFWCDRPSSEQEKQRDLLTVQIEVIHAEVKARYGSPRMHAELLDRGHDCCVNTVARLMREAGIAAKTKRKFRHTTDSNHSQPCCREPPGSAVRSDRPEREVGGRYDLHCNS